MIISKKTIFSVFLVLCAAHFVTAQTKMTRDEYIARYMHIAIDHMNTYGIPASITLAQGILESGTGNSTLAREANNHFGIKCHTDWTGERIYHRDDKPNECFRVYESPEESFEDHAKFLSDHRQNRYDSLFVYSHDDYRSWARGLKAAGYATAADYDARLIKIIEDEEIYLLDREDGEVQYRKRKGFESQDSMQNTLPPLPPDPAPKPNPKDTPGKINPNGYRVTIEPYRGYDVYRCNGVPFVYAKEGDTYEKLGTLFRISANRLRKFNDVPATATLKAGDIVYIERKLKSWEASSVHLYVVEDSEESLWLISQYHGMQLKPLARLNKAKTDAKYRKGSGVKLR